MEHASRRSSVRVPALTANRREIKPGDAVYSAMEELGHFTSYSRDLGMSKD